MSFFDELKRRNVVRTAVLYVVGSWLALQVADILFDAFELPNWSMRLLIAILIVGFPLVVVFSWVFELTPEGLKREGDESRGATSTTSGRRMNIAIAVLLVLAIGAVAIDRMVPDSPVQPDPAAVPDRSIAVLPLVNISDEPDSEIFSDGLSEELLNMLAGIPELQVSARTSSFSFKDSGTDVRSIGERLNVAHVLEGSVRKTGDKLRISVQLVNTETGFELWSATFDRELDDVFAVQNEIATETASALALSLIGESPRVRETDPDAFSAYLHGLHFYRQRTPESYDKAIAYLEQAIDIDPEYAPAWNLLGSTYANQSLSGQLPFDEGHERAMAVVNKALELDPDYSFANSARGWLAMTYERDYETSAAFFQRALRLTPGNPVILMNAAVLARTLGLVERAIAMTEEAIRRDPIGSAGYVNLSDQLTRIGRVDEAVTAAQKAVELTPGSVIGTANLALSYVLAGQPQRAIDTIDAIDRRFYILLVYAIAHHDLGNADQADAALQSLAAEYSDRRAFYIAIVYAWRNEVNSAFDWLDRAIEEGQPTLGIRTEPMLSGLFNDPRWDTLLARIGLSDEKVAAIDF